MNHAQNQTRPLPDFLHNTKKLKYRKLEVRIGESVKVAKRIKARSVNAVFIDGNHSYENAVADIKAWLPKIKVGGIIAGHDYDYDSVLHAIGDTLKGEIIPYGRCWLTRL